VSDWLIRAERPEDEAAITGLTEAAFHNAMHASGSESAIPARLRDSGELPLSLVAESDGQLVGHAAFLP
jgi:putative acetyltransferase